MAQRVFISYSRKDLEFVKRLAADLEARGLAVWLDKVYILPENWLHSNLPLKPITIYNLGD